MIFKRKRNVFTALVLTALILIGIPCYASSTQQLDEITQENETSEIRLANIEDRLAALEAEKGDVQSYLSELSSQLDEMTVSMQTLRQQYEQKEAEIAQTEAELAEAKEDEQAQYENMKLRIQYIYEESASMGMLTALLSSDSFMEFLTRVNNVSQINQYDRDMLQVYSDTIEEIEEKEAKLIEERQEIEDLKNMLTEQKEQIEVLYETTYNELKSIEASIQSSESEAAALMDRIAEQEEAINMLLIQQYEEEIAAAAAKAAEEAAAQAQTETAAAGTAVIVEGQTDTEQTATGNLTYLGNFKLTAYCSCTICCGTWSSAGVISASGAECVEGVTVAMGGVPFGTQLSINGHIYTVQDRGTSYGHVDVYFSSHAAALQFGVQYADVYLVQ